MHWVAIWPRVSVSESLDVGVSRNRAPRDPMKSLAGSAAVYGGRSRYGSGEMILLRVRWM